MWTTFKELVGIQTTFKELVGLSKLSTLEKRGKMKITFKELVGMKGDKVLSQYTAISPAYIRQMANGTKETSERTKTLITAIVKAKWPEMEVTFAQDNRHG